jgi:hypothetical protein
MIVHVFAILTCEHQPVLADQEICRQAEAPSFRVEGGHRPTFPQTMQDGSSDWTPRSPVKQRAWRGFNTKLGIQTLLRVRDDQERQVSGMGQQVLSARVKHCNLRDPRGQQLRMSLGERMQMQIADRAAGEASELQMSQSPTRSDIHGAALDGLEPPPRDAAPDTDPPE